MRRFLNEKPEAMACRFHHRVILVHIGHACTKDALPCTFTFRLFIPLKWFVPVFRAKETPLSCGCWSPNVATETFRECFGIAVFTSLRDLETAPPGIPGKITPLYGCLHNLTHSKGLTYDLD